MYFHKLNYIYRERVGEREKKARFTGRTRGIEERK